jgi:hypothetical protein
MAVGTRAVEASVMRLRGTAPGRGIRLSTCSRTTMEDLVGGPEEETKNPTECDLVASSAVADAQSISIT